MPDEQLGTAQPAWRDKRQLTERMIKLLQTPADCIITISAISGKFSFRRDACGCRRPVHRAGNSPLFAPQIQPGTDVIVGIDHQFFGGEQYLH